MPTRFLGIDPISYYLWIKTWSEETIKKYCNEKFGEASELFSKVSWEQAREIQKWAEKLYVEDSPESICKIHSVFTDIIWQAFYRSGKSSISFANFHELLLTPTDIQTVKKISKGFDYVEYGKIDFLKEGQLQVQISEASDLFFKILHDEYIREEEYAHSTIRDVNKDMSIKIWIADNRSYGQDLEDFVEKILYVSSNKTGLNFKRYFFQEIEKDIGESNNYEIELNNVESEITPIRFFNLSNHTTSPRLKYLTFYQSLEFFYLDDKSIVISEKIKELQNSDGNITISSVNELSKTLGNFSSEISNLKIVVGKRLNLAELTQWLAASVSRKKYLSKNLKYEFVDAIDTNGEESIINSVSNRIYKVRCSIAHSKKGHNQYSLEPFIDDLFIQEEIPLIQFIATDIINNSYEIG